MANYKIYAPNNNHSCDYGVDFFNGVAHCNNDEVVKWFRAHGYYVEKTSDTALTQIDKMSKEDIQAILTKYSVALPAASDSIKIEKREVSLALAKCMATAVAASGNIGSTTFKATVTVTYAKSAAAESGTVPTDSSTGLGTIITVKECGLTAPEGKTFSHWVDGAGNQYVKDDKIRLGADALTLTAVYKDA